LSEEERKEEESMRKSSGKSSSLTSLAVVREEKFVLCGAEIKTKASHK